MTIYIFGYGSIINFKYVSQLKNKKRNNFPIKLNNHIRHWIYTSSEKVYLGLYYNSSDNSAHKTNGILIEVDSDELNLLDKREKYYIRKEINKNDIIQSYENVHLNQNDKIYAYYSDPLKSVKYIFDFNSVQQKKYLYNVLSGCIKISSKFFADFLFSTTGWMNKK